jgi:SAM-dependent methyltransferase
VGDVTDPRVAPAAARFGDLAARYERVRPAYPAAILAALARRTGLEPGTIVIDLGAGTGTLTRQLADLGADVTAVEPSAGMRARCAAAVPGAAVVDGTAEAVPVATASADVVTAAQAIHWFVPGPALDEIARVLRPGGWLAVVGYDTPPGGWAAEFWHLRRELTGFAAEYPGLGWEAVVDADPRFGPRETDLVVVRATTTPDGLRAEGRSRSALHALDPAGRARVEHALAGFLATHPETAGRSALAYDRPCVLHLCRRLP